MKKIIVIIFSFFIAIKCCNGISASSYVVMDMDTNNIIMGNNINDKKLIASITKIMTTIIAIENGNLNKKITAKEDILQNTGSLIYIEPGETLTLRDLLYGLILRSGNDAAYLIANEISENMDNFANLMNKYAKKIGMNNSYFVNAHGLENSNTEYNYSTAYDMAILTSYAMKNKTFKKIFGTKEYKIKSNKKTYLWKNKNKLLKYDYITGGKTGYTKKAKRTLVTTGTINDMNIIIVTLNDPDDWNDHLLLYKNISTNYQRFNILNVKKFKVIDDGIYLDNKLYIKKDYYMILKNKDDIKIKSFIYNKKHYKNGDRVGIVRVYKSGVEVYNEDVYIKKKDKKNKFSKLLKKFI